MMAQTLRRERRAGEALDVSWANTQPVVEALLGVWTSEGAPGFGISVEAVTQRVDLGAGQVEQLLDLLATRVGEGQVRLASGDEAEAFEERQYEGYETKETVARMRKMYGKGGLGNEQTS